MALSVQPTERPELAPSSVVVRLVPLLLAYAAALVGYPPLGLLLVPISWVWLARGGPRPRWATALLVVGTIGWLALTLLVIVPVRGAGGTAH